MQDKDFKVNQTLKLRDGRTLGYAEYGDTEGNPIFFFHGTAGSRLFRHPDESIATSLLFLKLTKTKHE